MQTPAIFTPSVQTTVIANGTPVLHELTLSEMLTVSGGLPRGGWAVVPSEVQGLQTSAVTQLPRGGW